MKKIKLFNSDKEAKVDDRDYAWLNKFKWFAIEIDGNCHAGREVIIEGERKIVLMEEDVMRRHRTKND